MVIFRSAAFGPLAEGAGFEPAIRFPAYTLSRRAPSTTRPPLHCSVSWTKESTYALPVGFLKSLGMPNVPERRSTIVRRAASASELWRCRQTIQIHGHLSCWTSRRKPGLSLASLWCGDRQACASGDSTSSSGTFGPRLGAYENNTVHDPAPAELAELHLVGEARCCHVTLVFGSRDHCKQLAGRARR